MVINVTYFKQTDYKIIIDLRDTSCQLFPKPGIILIIIIGGLNIEFRILVKKIGFITNICQYSQNTTQTLKSII